MIHPATIHDFKMSLFYLPFRKESAPVNMATDMWLLSKAALWGGTIFRRYGWNTPEITFGYGQKADWVCDETGSSIDSITRRPTGGGIVRHGTDLTYCLVAPRGSRAEQMPPMQFYGFIHEKWAEALQEEGINCSLMPCPQQSKSNIPGDCFKEPVGRDLMDSSGKIKLGGAAMKRTRSGMLLQGTLELGEWPELNHSEIEARFLNLFAKDISEELCPRQWPPELETERAAQVKNFQSLMWNQKRKSLG